MMILGYGVCSMGIANLRQKEMEFNKKDHDEYLRDLELFHSRTPGFKIWNIDMVSSCHSEEAGKKKTTNIKTVVIDQKKPVENMSREEKYEAYLKEWEAMSSYNRKGEYIDNDIGNIDSMDVNRRFRDSF